MPDSPRARTPAATRPPTDPAVLGWTPFSEVGGDQVGVVLDGRFRLLERIGRGGMGSVFLAEDLALRSRAAVKLLRTVDPDARRRFVEEATILANLRLPHLVQVLAVGEADDGTPFMAMEHLGQNLEARLQKSGGPLPWREVVEIAAQVAVALEVLHRASVIHRDVKPSNIAELRGATGRPLVKLIDLGVARVEDWARVQGGGPSLPARAPTRDGKVIGTPGFVPPESRYCRADPRFDVYGLGVTIFKLITGVMPDPEAPRAMREARAGLDVSDDLEALVAASIAAVPEMRIASAEELGRRLAAIRTVHAGDGEPVLFDGCYELIELLGVGARAEVYRAYHRDAARTVALKVLREEAEADPAERRHLAREARALSAVTHSSIPALIDCRTGPSRRRPFIAMDLVRGRRASDFCLAETRLSAGEVLAVGEQLAGALAVLRERGILHRDLSASNVIIDRALDRGGQVRASLIDLGSVELQDRFYAVVDQRYPTPPEARVRIDVAGLDRLEWTAPEARDGGAWTGRSDVYSLGLLLYRLLTGKRPVKDDRGEWVSPEEIEPECPGELASAILAALQEDPSRRLDALGLLGRLEEARAELAGEAEGGAREAQSRPPPTLMSEVAAVSPSARRESHEVADRGEHAWFDPRGRGFIGGFVVAMMLVIAAWIGRATAPERGGVAIAPSVEAGAQVTTPEQEMAERPAQAITPPESPSPPALDPTKLPTMRAALDAVAGDLRRCSITAGGLLLVEFETAEDRDNFVHTRAPGEDDPAIVGCVRDAVAGVRFAPTAAQTFTEEYTP